MSPPIINQKKKQSNCAIDKGLRLLRILLKNHIKVLWTYGAIRHEPKKSHAKKEGRKRKKEKTEKMVR